MCLIRSQLSREEFEEALRGRRVVHKLALLDVDAHELQEVWHMLAKGEPPRLESSTRVLVAGDGSLSVEEFIMGMRKMRGEAQSKDVLLCLNHLRRLETKVDRIVPLVLRLFSSYEVVVVLLLDGSNRWY